MVLTKSVIAKEGARYKDDIASTYSLFLVSTHTY